MTREEFKKLESAEIEKALNLLRSILPTQTDALQNIKQEILDKKYLEE